MPKQTTSSGDFSSDLRLTPLSGELGLQTQKQSPPHVINQRFQLSRIRSLWYSGQHVGINGSCWTCIWLFIAPSINGFSKTFWRTFILCRSHRLITMYGCGDNTTVMILTSTKYALSPCLPLISTDSTTGRKPLARECNSWTVPLAVDKNIKILRLMWEWIFSLASPMELPASPE